MAVNHKTHVLYVTFEPKLPFDAKYPYKPLRQLEVTLE